MVTACYTDIDRAAELVALRALDPSSLGGDSDGWRRIAEVFGREAAEALVAAVANVGSDMEALRDEVGDLKRELRSVRADVLDDLADVAMEAYSTVEDAGKRALEVAGEWAARDWQDLDDGRPYRSLQDMADRVADHLEDGAKARAER
jgi:hypothetical protein